MAAETHIGRALLRTPVLLGMMTLSAVLALAAACGGEEEGQGEPTTTPTHETRTPTLSPSAPETETPGGTPAVVQPTPAVVQPTPTVVQRTPTVAQPTPTVQPRPTPPVVEGVSVDDDPSWGPEDAPVTIIEFSEFLCPYCQRFALQTLPQIKQAYEGKVKYVYRDFIVHGEPATKISEATECADDQDKFWEYHDKLWEEYQTVGQQAGTGMDALATTLKGYASDLGLDTATFDDCLDSGKHTAEVQKDSQDARSYGVSGTPAFFINGQMVSGAQPFSVFKAVIDAALEGGESSSAIPTVPSRAGG